MTARGSARNTRVVPADVLLSLGQIMVSHCGVSIVKNYFLVTCELTDLIIEGTDDELT